MNTQKQNKFIGFIFYTFNVHLVRLAFRSLRIGSQQDALRWEVVTAKVRRGSLNKQVRTCFQLSNTQLKPVVLGPVAPALLKD